MRQQLEVTTLAKTKTQAASASIVLECGYTLIQAFYRLQAALKQFNANQLIWGMHALSEHTASTRTPCAAIAAKYETLSPPGPSRAASEILAVPPSVGCASPSSKAASAAIAAQFRIDCLRFSGFNESEREYFLVRTRVQ